MGGTCDPVTGVWTGQASLEFVPVGNPGNAADPATGSLYGSVGYNYNIGKYDVTVGQYCQFLNAVAKTDTYGLYHSDMAFPGTSGPGTGGYGCGIVQNGSSGNYAYSVLPDSGVPGQSSYTNYANLPVNWVSWGSAARFCNWLQNGQPTGAEGYGTTETGAYTLNGAISDSDLTAVTRNAGARYFIPSESEWYKAAYYDPNKPGGAGYWTYPTKSNTAPINILSSTGTNNANFYDYYGTGNGGYTDPTNYLTPVGAFAASPGPYDTFDMGGDVFQWNETVFGQFPARGLRGSCWNYFSDDLAASTFEYIYPSGQSDYVGFRVASVPEPGSITLLLVGELCLLAYAWRRRK
jgi:formylglycine-generating enzyme required for sulfatase activity